MFTVYIEENAFSTPQPMEVSPDVSIEKVIPALVEELRLPQTDPSGNHLIYFLRHATDGRVLPGHFSLRAAGIYAEDHLALESYATEEAPILAASTSRTTSQRSSFYAGQTIADSGVFGGASNSAPLVLGATPTQQGFIAGSLSVSAPLPGGQRRWPRRAFLLAGGAVLGAAGAGLAYAAYQTLAGNQKTVHTLPGMLQQTRATAPAATATMKAPQAVLPTHATQILVFKRHRQIVRSVAWSPDGTMLASGASDRQLFTWNVNGQAQLNKGLGATVHALTWSPDNRQLAAAATNQIFFLNARNGTTEAHSTRTHHATITTLVWSPQQPQMLVSAGLDKLAVVWDTRNFQPQIFFRQHTAGILAAGWASDGQTVVSSSQGGAVRVWNAPNGQELHGFFFDGAVSMNAVAFNPRGTSLAAGGMDGKLRLWPGGLTCQQMGKGQCLDAPQRFTGHAQAIRALGWSPDGRLLATGGDDGRLLVWNPTQSQTPLFQIAQNAPILALGWSPDGQKIATASGNTVTLWALA